MHGDGSNRASKMKTLGNQRWTAQSCIFILVFYVHIKYLTSAITVLVKSNVAERARFSQKTSKDLEPFFVFKTKIPTKTKMYIIF